MIGIAMTVIFIVGLLVMLKDYIVWKRFIIDMVISIWIFIAIFLLLKGV